MGPVDRPPGHLAARHRLIGNLGDGANGPKFQVARASDHLTYVAIPSMTWPEYGWPWLP